MHHQDQQRRFIDINSEANPAPKAYLKKMRTISMDTALTLAHLRVTGPRPRNGATRNTNALGECAMQQ